jgi:hypothetical protein
MPQCFYYAYYIIKPPADSKLTQKRQQPAAAPPTPQLHTPIKVEEKVTLAVSVICVCFFTTALTRFFFCQFQSNTRWQTKGKIL